MDDYVCNYTNDSSFHTCGQDTFFSATSLEHDSFLRYNGSKTTMKLGEIKYLVQILDTNMDRLGKYRPNKRKEMMIRETQYVMYSCLNKDEFR